ncbi:ketopantoate reductase family protein [Natronorubrum sp. FCH18a]|uniref:ketopantoate reductase family protein n=1 Tax=Natronorubrum sp. FCH18a TaxID=3447018 RepID=UPI003F5133FF
MDSAMKVAVIGPGALGCLFGGRLALAGHEVWLLHHRQAAVDRLNEQGLRIDSDGTTHRVAVPATTDAADVGHADLVIVFVKSHVTESALEQHAACIGPDTAVLSLQNGLRHDERLREFVGDRRAIAGVTYQGAVMEEPGRVRHTSDGVSTFGGGDTTTVRNVARTLSEAALPAEVVDDPTTHIWSKQLISLPVKPLASLTRLSNGELVDCDETRAVMEFVVEEAIAVADAKGIELTTDDPMDEIVRTCRASYSHDSSMLQDVRAERKTELDEVNGALVEMGREEGVDVSVNALLTRLVRGLEYSYLEE